MATVGQFGLEPVERMIETRKATWLIFSIGLFFEKEGRGPCVGAREYDHAGDGRSKRQIEDERGRLWQERKRGRSEDK